MIKSLHFYKESNGGRVIAHGGSVPDHISNERCSMEFCKGDSKSIFQQKDMTICHGCIRKIELSLILGKYNLDLID